MDAGTTKQKWNYRRKSRFGKDSEFSLDKSGVSVGHPGGAVHQAAENTGLELEGVIRVRDLGVISIQCRKKNVKRQE